MRSRFARTLTRPLPEGEEKREALRQIDPKIPDEARKEALRSVLRLDFSSRLSANSKHPRTFATLRDALLPKLLGEALSVAERGEKPIKSHKISETVQAYLH